MKKLIIIITSLISICFAAIVIGVLFLANLDLNNYKDWLSEQFYDQTGRQLTITGNIQSTIYPWLGLEIEGLNIANPAGFSNSNFLSAEQAAFRIKLMPLLKQEYEIDTVLLSGAALNLEVDPNGNNNWSSLADSGEEPVEESVPGEGLVFNKLIIGGVAVDTVQVNYVNRANGQTVNAENITVNIPALVYGEPLELDMNLHLSANNPNIAGITDIESDINLNSTVIYDLTNSIYTLENFRLEVLDSRLEANLSSNDGNISGSINFNTERTPELIALFGQSELAERMQGMQGLDSSINLITAVTYDFDNNIYRLENLDLEFLGSSLEADLRNNDGSINGSINFSSENASELLTLFDQAELAERIDDIQLLVYLDGNAENLLLLPFDLNFSLSGEPLISPTNIHLYTNAELNLDDENLMLNDLSISALDLLLEGKFNVGNFMSQPDINGEFDIRSFNPKTLSTALTFDLPQTRDPNVLEQIAFSSSLSASGTSADLNRFIVEIDDTLITGSLSVDDFNQPDMNFDVSINTIDIDRYLAPEPTTVSPVDNQTSTDTSYTSLQSLIIDGELSIDELKVSGLSLSNVLLGLNADQGLIELAPIQANLYQGSYRGAANLNVNNAQPQFSLQSELQNISIEPLSNDFIGASYASGKGNITLALVGSGIDAQDIINSLNGSADLSLNEGVLEGVDVGAVLAQLETMIRSRRILAVQRGTQTAFDNLTATIQIENGIARSNDLLLQAPGFNVTGRGTLANLQNQSLNFDLLASVNAATASVEAEEYDIGGYSLPINCSGSMNSPLCLPDVNSILSVAIGNVIQEGVGNVLQQGVGGLLDRVLGTGSQPQTDSSNSEPAETNPEPAEPTDPTEEILNNVLDRLFR